MTRDVARFEFETVFGARGVVDRNLAYSDPKSCRRVDSWFVLREVPTTSRPSRESEPSPRELLFDLFFAQWMDFDFLFASVFVVFLFLFDFAFFFVFYVFV